MEEMIKETIGLVKNMADRNQTVGVFAYHSEFEIGLFHQGNTMI